MKKFLALFFSISLAINCPAQKKTDFSSLVGIVASDSHGSYLSISNGGILRGTKLVVVWTSEPDLKLAAKLKQAQIIRRLTKCDAAVTNNGDRCYSIDLPKDMFEGRPPGFGLLVPTDRLNFDGTNINCDIDLDGVKEEFRTCTSSEGIHLTIWSGTPGKGKLRWHRYYYLGYDVEPTCSDFDTKEK